MFGPPVWVRRRDNFGGFHPESAFAELVIESSNPVLVHGPVADVIANAPRVAQVIAAGGFSGSFECYDETGTLIDEGPFGGDDEKHF